MTLGERHQTSRSSAGFGMVEVLVALGIAGILVAGLMSFMSLSFKMMAAQNADQAIALVLDETRIQLSKMNICTTQNLGTLHFDPSAGAPMALTVLKDGGGNAFASVGATLPSGGGASIEAITVDGFQDISDSANGSEYSGMMSITFNRGDAIGPAQVVRKLPMSFRTTLNAPNDVTIDQCQLGVAPANLNLAADLAQLLQNVCSSLGGSYDETTNQCVNLTAAAATAPAGSKCGRYFKDPWDEIHLPCQGYSLKIASPVCPAGYSLYERMDFMDLKRHCVKD